MDFVSTDVIKISLTILGGIAGGGWAVISMTKAIMEKSLEANRKLFSEKFDWAEHMRQENGARWERHFQKVEDRLDRAFNLMDSMDRRVTIIELCLRRAPCGKLLDGDIPTEACQRALQNPLHMDPPGPDPRGPGE